MRKVAWVMVVVGSLGCGDNLDVPQWQSGARLRATTATTDDGFSMLLGWHDALLGSDCGVSQDCEKRVLSAAYADAQCMNVVKVTSRPIGRFIQDPFSREIYAVDPQPTPLYFAPGGNCIPTRTSAHRVEWLGMPVEVSTRVPLDAPMYAGWGIYEWHWVDGASAVDVQESSALGSHEGQIEAGIARLRRYEIPAPTTSNLRAYRRVVYDSKRDEQCWPWRAGNGDTYCLPVAPPPNDPYAALPARVYSGESCSIEADVLAYDEITLARDAAGEIDHLLYPTGELLEGTFSQWFSCQIAGPCCLTVHVARGARRVELTEFEALTVTTE
jgi:hypothetical protein